MIKDALVECPNGLAAIIGEFHSKGYGRYLVYDETDTPTGLAMPLTRIYPEPAADMLTPTLAVVRGPAADMDILFAETWANANILALVDEGGDIYQAILDNPTALSTYRSYRHWLPYRDVEGNETDVNTGTLNLYYWEQLPDGEGGFVPNSSYLPIKDLGRWQ